MLDLSVVQKLHSFLEVDTAVDKMNETSTRGVKMTNIPATVLTQPVSERFLRRMASSSPTTEGNATQQTKRQHSEHGP